MHLLTFIKSKVVFFISMSLVMITAIQCQLNEVTGRTFFRKCRHGVEMSIKKILRTVNRDLFAERA